MNRPSRPELVRLLLARGALVAICVGLVLRSRSVRTGGASGDLPIFLEAGRRLAAGENIYETPIGTGYVYPPFPAMLFAGLERLGPSRAAWILAIASATMVWVAATIGASAAATRLGADGNASSPGTGRRGAWTTAWIAVLGVLLSLDQLRAVVNGGQTDMLLVLPVVLGLAWQARRPVLAGVALGLAANVKYVTLVFLPLMLWRRQWRLAAATIAGTLLFAVLPAAVSGWDQNALHWRMALAGMGRLAGADVDAAEAAPVGGVTQFNSISIASAFSRWLMPEYGRRAADAATGCVALMMLAVCWGLYRRERTPLLVRSRDDPREPALGWLEWTGLITAVLALGPQAQARHFVLLLPMSLATAVMLLRPRVGRGLLVAGVVLLQIGLNVPFGQLGFRKGMDWWHSAAGGSWCLLAMYTAYLWTGLRTANAAAGDSPGKSGGQDRPGVLAEASQS